MADCVIVPIAERLLSTLSANYLFQFIKEVGVARQLSVRQQG